MTEAKTAAIHDVRNGWRSAAESQEKVKTQSAKCKKPSPVPAGRFPLYTNA
jgi:hypothetical protein